MSDRETVPKGFESPYESFVWKELSIIRELEREGEFYRALKYATSLTKYLDPRVRKQHHEKGKRIIAIVDSEVAKRRGIDAFTRWQEQNRVAAFLGKVYLEEFITALTETMGARAYMEKHGRKVFRGTFEG